MGGVQSSDVTPPTPYLTQSHTYTLKMPKKMNTDKAAAAVYQNAKAIEEAKNSGGIFGAVTRSLGNRGFEIQLRLAEKGKSTHGVLVQATPRKLFQGGKKAPIRIAVGHVVLLAGELKAKDAGIQRPLEIVARLDNRAEIQELIKAGRMSSTMLGIAETAGAVETEKELAKEVLFEEEEDDEFWTAGLQEAKGGLKQQRQAAETVATISARVATLMGQKEGRRKGADGCVAEGKTLTAAKGSAAAMLDAELTVEEMTPAEQAEFIRWRAARQVLHSARQAAGGGPRVTVAQVEREIMLAAQTAESAAEEATLREELACAARAAEISEFLAQRTIAENWDDEVNIEDL